MQGLVRKREHFWSVTLFLVNGQARAEEAAGHGLAVPARTDRRVARPAGRSSRATPSRKTPARPTRSRSPRSRRWRCSIAITSSSAWGTASASTPTAPRGSATRRTGSRRWWCPTYEVPRTTPPTVADWPKLAGLVVDMKELGETPDRRAGGEAAAPAHRLCGVDRRPAGRPRTSPTWRLYQKPGQAALERCRETPRRIEAGLTLLLEDEKAAEAFRFANLAMWQQRVHTIISLKQAAGRAGGRAGHRRARQPLVVSLPAGLHPAQPAGDHPARPQGPLRRGRGDGRPALVPHRRRQDRGVPRAVGLHDGPAAAPGDRWPGARASTAWRS